MRVSAAFMSSLGGLLLVILVALVLVPGCGTMASDPREGPLDRYALPQAHVDPEVLALLEEIALEDPEFAALALEAAYERPITWGAIKACYELSGNDRQECLEDLRKRDD